MLTLDLSLENTLLYHGIDVEEVAGRKNVTTPISQAVAIIGRNINTMLASVPGNERGLVTLTGPMAVWAYLVVFHAVVHVFGEVRYFDGRNPPVTVAKHG